MPLRSDANAAVIVFKRRAQCEGAEGPLFL